MHPYEFNADNAAVLNQNALGCREELKSNAFGPGSVNFFRIGRRRCFNSTIRNRNLTAGLDDAPRGAAAVHCHIAAANHDDISL